MAGDDLTICLFFLACAVTFGLEAVKAETTVRRISFAAIALGCLLSGIFWVQVKTVWPTLTDKIAAIATNPVSWFVIVMFFLAVIAFHSPRKPTTSLVTTASAPPSDATEQKPEKREFVDITPTFLIGIMSDSTRTRVQNQRVIEPYIGKWLKITGNVNDIYPNSIFFCSEDHPDKQGYNLMLAPTDEWKSQFHLLERGRKITVIGKFTEVGSQCITLRECELV